MLMEDRVKNDLQNGVLLTIQRKNSAHPENIYNHL